MDRADEDARGDERLDRPSGDVQAPERGDGQRDGVPGGEGERDAADPAERATGPDQAVPAPPGGREWRGQEQDQQEQQVIGAGEDVVAAQLHHGQETAPGAAVAEVDLQGGDGHGPGVDPDGADLGGVLAVDLSGGPVLTYRHQDCMRDDLVDDDVVAEGEVAYVGATAG